MKRRDFMKGTLGTALGAGLASAPLKGLATQGITRIESEDIDGRAMLKDDFDLHFVAVGDWGRNGADHQLQVARQMGAWTTEHPNHFRSEERRVGKERRSRAAE